MQRPIGYFQDPSLYQNSRHVPLFLRKHASTVYDLLTARRSKFVRIEDMVYAAADLVPGLTPTRAVVDAENECAQKDKDGHEVDQGIFAAHMLANEQNGRHLCHAMLLPHARTSEVLEEFIQTGRYDLGKAVVERKNGATTVYLKNPRFLNAEDDTTVDDVEVGVDLCTLDPETTIAVMRGAAIDQGKYQGKQVFCTGVNLTHLYQGKLSYLWYLKREMGFLNKIYRGVASPDVDPDEVFGATTEKLWMAAIDKFAIGGGCQYLLVMDYNIAGKNAYMTLPARKEGIIPGAANIRLPRFVGDRIARQAILNDLRIDCDSPEGRMICDLIVEDDDLDSALQQAIDRITTSGVVSAASNRRAIRVAQEPVDMFRRFMAVYARDQAYCHFSPALIANLERFWGAANRKE